MRELLTESELDRSSVVANCRMNRERTLTGPNGYARELGFNPLDQLLEHARSGRHFAWLDLCCGTGAALLEAAAILREQKLTGHIALVGVDLVIREAVSHLSWPRFVEASLATWNPSQPFDLITCVHGLHYIGDKLGLITRAVSWLTDNGRFAANLDLANIHIEGCTGSSRLVASELRKAGLTYHARKKLLECQGRRLVNLPLSYLGADDRVGPNYTGQPAVASFYAH
jgi:SAM-dependent methyltransferase